MRRFLLPVLMLCAVASTASAQDAVCQDPEAQCEEKLSSDCVGRIRTTLMGSVAPEGECRQQYEAFRACVAKTSKCPSKKERLMSAPADAPVVDPALVGVWAMTVPTSEGGLSRWHLEIGADGAYVFSVDDPNLKSAVGVFRAADGKWSIRTSDWEDSGMYRIPTEDSVIFIGKAGAQIWSRVEQTD